MNKLQSAILWLAVFEVILCCFFMPVFLFRLQEIELSREVKEEEILSASLSAYDNSLLADGKSGLSMDQKVDIANSYDNTVTSIYLEKGENYTANQICSIAAGELEKICVYYQDVSPLLKRLIEMNIFEPIRACGTFLETQSHGESEDGIGYADVETVDEVDVDMDSVYVNGDNEVRVETMMYINSSEPEQAFIVWQINYYNLKEDTTLFLLFDDETGKFLSVTGSMSGFNEKENYSLYEDSRKNAALIKEYYQKEDQGILEIIEE